MYMRYYIQVCHTLLCVDVPEMVLSEVSAALAVLAANGETCLINNS